ncbi:MAG TPA: hypothetical protein VFV38_19910 [Ktedonobacteraceae bacterium]|nr:hypothetical protein [Ktedonobacteraceae bacterium]
MDKKHLHSLILEHQMRSNERLSLVPSENVLNISARMAFVSDILHRYSFPVDSGNNWSWPGSAELAEIEKELQASLQRMFQARYINTKSISGLNCMTIALAALTRPDITVFSIAQEDGGHGSTAFVSKKLGLRIEFLPINPHDFSIDLEKACQQLRHCQGRKVIYLDQFMCLFPHDLRRLREVAGEDCIIHYDGSHTMGLIAGGQFQDPLREGADILAGSTHKTYPGPHKGIIVTNNEALHANIEENSMYFVSHHHAADIVALALATQAFEENREHYARQVITNAQTLGNELFERGFQVCAAHKGFTASHQLWIDIANICHPFDASRLLLETGIVVNAIDIPYIPSKLGVRLGTQEVTHLGMKETEMAEIARIFEDVLIKNLPVEGARKRVCEMKAQFSTSLFDDDEFCDELLALIWGGHHERNLRDKIFRA